MTTTLSKRPQLKRALIGVGAAAGALVLSVGASTAAYAATITSADRDIAEVSYDGDLDQLVIWGHDHDTGLGFNPAADTYVVDNAYTAGGGFSGWYLDEEEAEDEISLGLAAEDSLFADLGGVAPGSRTLTYTVSVVSDTDDNLDNGRVTIWEGTPTPSSPVIDTTGAADSFQVTLVNGVEFHQHYNWLFSKQGTYYVTFSASANAGADPATPVTVTFDVP